jgi:hypothetical protein
MKLTLSDEQEGWFPLAAPVLRGEVIQVLPGQADDNPLYVVKLDEPLEIQVLGAATASGLSQVFYPLAVIKSRWKGTDIGTERNVSVYLLLPPPGAVAEGRARLVQLPIQAWASCNLLE